MPSYRHLLPLDALIRAISINKGSPHAVFLGAGASISSGIPSAETCIWLWKREIFLTNNPGLRDQYREISLAAVQERIQRWLDGQPQFLPPADANEYGFYAERCFPIPQDRRQYFQSLISGRSPSVGYQVLCLLARAGMIHSVWTTNFDSFAVRAAAATALVPIEVGLDTSDRIRRQVVTGELLHVALHGDFRYDNLKNTSAEVQRQNTELSAGLVDVAAERSLLVVGYSGRDCSVMRVLTDAYSKGGVGTLYWCGHESAEPSPAVAELIRKAHDSGRQAYYTPTDGFDDLLYRLAMHCLSGDLVKEAISLCATFRDARSEDGSPFTLALDRAHTLIKSNAIPVTVPTEVFQLAATGFDGPDAFAELDEVTRPHDVAATLFKGRVLALGTVDAIRHAFGSRVVGGIERIPLDKRDFSVEDGAISALLLSGLLRAIASSRGLITDGRKLLWRSDIAARERVDEAIYVVHEAAIIYLRWFRDRHYLVMKPTIKCFGADGLEAPPDDADMEIKRRRLTRQYNREFNAALNAWHKTLVPDKPTTYEFPPNCASGLRFVLSYTPLSARIKRQSGGPRIPVESFRLATHDGVELPEPFLVFSNRQGDGYATDQLPVRGILTHRPYDYSLTTRGIQDRVTVGIVAPKRDFTTLSRFLHDLHVHVAANTKQEYLVDYPGFAQGFGLPLDISEARWIDCPEPSDSLGPEEGTRALVANILGAIARLEAAGPPNVVIIYIPRRWAAWNRYETESESFDLHDFVKAACVQRGIASQFLREETFAKGQRCEILWWLALSCYAKALRTPWVLKEWEPRTAFVGIGYGIEPRAERGSHIVLGCSHLYTGDGVGLRYRLSKIENPIWRKKNPFMSFEDARRLAETVKQLFFEATSSLPQRVVFHKRTPFIRDERNGLREGLRDVQEIDMLEINVDRAMRFVSARTHNGKWEEANFPVARGTAVILEPRRFLLWVHGSTKALNPSQTYYQGKSRIPAPLMVIRHCGTSPLALVAREILGLSKMDWNSFDLYSKFPATLSSSSAIARIGSLLQRFGARSYDYRLFI